MLLKFELLDAFFFSLYVLACFLSLVSVLKQGFQLPSGVLHSIRLSKISCQYLMTLVCLDWEIILNYKSSP